MNQGILLLDPDDTIVLYNKVVVDMVGVPESLLAGRPKITEVHDHLKAAGEFTAVEPETEARIAAWREAAPSGEPHVYERVRPNGIILSVWNKPLPGGGWVRVSTDITERRRAEQAAAENTRYLELVLESMNDGLIVMDASHHITLFNRRTCEILEVPAAFLAGRPSNQEFWDLQAANGEFAHVDPAEQRRIQDLINQSSHDEPFSYERLRANGNWVQVTHRPMPDGGTVRTIVDTTERKRAELAALEQNRLLELTLESMEQGLMVFDGADRLLLHNGKTAGMLGVPADMLGADTTLNQLRAYQAEHGEFARLPQATHDVFAHYSRQRELGDNSPYSYERERPDGTWLVVYTRPLPEGGMLRTMLDITDRKRIELELRENNRLLELTLQNMEQGLLVLDSDDRIALFNDKLAAMIGVPDAMLAPGSPAQALIDYQVAHGEFVRMSEEQRRLMTGRVTQGRRGADEAFGYERERPNGSWIYMFNRPLPDGGVIRTFLDITESKKAEQATTESERRIREILESSPIGVVMRDAETGTCLFANEAYAKLLGYSRDEVMSVANASRFVDPSMRGVMLAAVERDGRVDGFEVELRRKDGSIAWVLLHVLRMNVDGRRVNISWDYDLTERKRSEDAQRSLLDSIPVPLVLSRTDNSEVLYTNPVADRLYGLRHGAGDTGVVTSIYADPSRRQELFRRLRADGAVDEFEIELNAPGGKLWVLAYARLMTYGGHECAVVVSQGINERKQLEQKLAEESALLQAVLDHMGHSLIVYDAERRVVVVNRRFIDYYDVPPELIRPGLTQRDMIEHLARRNIAGVSPEALERRIDELLELSWPGGEDRRELSRPDGSVVVRAFHELPGGGAVVTHTDITDLKAAERSLTQAKTEAETALAELKAAQANLIQAEKMASLGQLVAGIAHEIKNPLNFVNNFAKVSLGLIEELREAVPAEDAARAAVEDVVGDLGANLGRIIEHGTRADSIVKTMLLHSRGSADLREQAVNTLVDEATSLAYHGERAVNQSFNAAIERDLDPAAGTAMLVPHDISRVLINLLTNAFHAVAERARNAGAGYRPEVRVATRDAGGQVEIRVRDNGTGMTDEVKAKLFTPFFTTKAGMAGTGLGLSLSYDIVVRQHHGSIVAETEAGQFSEFIVRLPRQRNRPRPSAPFRGGAGIGA
jgi:PAS domain S-box-containing protein